MYSQPVLFKSYNTQVVSYNTIQIGTKGKSIQLASLNRKSYASYDFRSWIVRIVHQSDRPIQKVENFRKKWRLQNTSWTVAALSYIVYCRGDSSDVMVAGDDKKNGKKKMDLQCRKWKRMKEEDEEVDGW